MNVQGPIDTGSGDKPPSRTSNPLAALAPPAAKSVLEAGLFFHFEVAVTQSFVGPVPGGYRVDLRYEAQPPPGAPLLLAGLKASARVLSGCDWLSISDDGVIDFDSRITFEVSEDAKNTRVPISGRFRGRADLRDSKHSDGTARFGEHEAPGTVLGAWLKGKAGATLPLALAVQFDVPTEGFSATETALYKALRESSFGRHLLIGRGKAYYDGHPNGGVCSLALSLYVLSATAAQSSHPSAEHRASAAGQHEVAL